MTILRDTIVRARKRHRCDLCSTPIDAGQRHHAQAVVWDDMIYTWREHEVCRDWATRLGLYAAEPDGISAEALLEDPAFAGWMQTLDVIGWRLDDWRLGRTEPTALVVEALGVRARYVDRGGAARLVEVSGPMLSVKRVEGRTGRWDVTVGGARVSLYDGGFGALSAAEGRA